MASIDLKEIMKSEYGIDIESVSKSDESTDGNVYIMSGHKEKYVIKVYGNYAHAESMAKLHEYLHVHDLNVPFIIKNLSGEYITTAFDGKYIVCYSFAKGVKLKQTDLTDDRIIAVAEYLTKLHSVDINEFNLETVPFKITSNRQSVLHFDVTKQNIFVDETTNDISFIDFDDAKFGSAVSDVAIALTNLFISRANGADIDGMKLFVNAYYNEDVSLKKVEMPLVKKAALEWLQRTLNNEKLGSSIIEGLNNKINIWNHLTVEEFDT